MSRQVAAKLALNTGGLQPVAARLSVATAACATGAQDGLSTTSSSNTSWNSVQNLQVNNLRNQMLGLDSSKGVDCISSPRSAFSRAAAKPIPMPDLRGKQVHGLSLAHMQNQVCSNPPIQHQE